MLKRIKENLKIILLTVAGSIIWSITMCKSGLIYNYGMGFWGPNGHDGIWHIALIENISKGSFQMPVFAGETIKNYHIGFDLILAFIHRVTHIPAINLYFQVIPPIIALILRRILVYKFVLLLRRSEMKPLGDIFCLFHRSIGWIITPIRHGELY
jgi:hypothetical protein